MSLFTPINQLKLTNVAVVRLKKGTNVGANKGNKQRFEIACYKNKVLEYRKNIEKNLDEVLQVPTVFVNVSKGELANKEDLIAAFGTDDQQAVCKIILEKGELQVSGKERSHIQEEQYKEIAHILAEKCVNPDTKLPYPPEFLESALHDTLHYSLHPSRNSKQQALDIIKMLQKNSPFPIARAQMRIRLYMSTKDGKRIREKLQHDQLVVSFEVEDFTSDYCELICLVNPGNFRLIETLVKSDTKGKGQVETLSLKDITLDDEHNS